jgi:hypothetical protein
MNIIFINYIKKNFNSSTLKKNNKVDTKISLEKIFLFFLYNLISFF